MTEQLMHLFGNERLAAQMNFIAEADKLKSILRRTVLLNESRQENDAEHSWHLALMLMVLSEYVNIQFSQERVLKMLIIHDLVEIYAGDTFAFDTAANVNKAERENHAAHILFGLLPIEQNGHFRELWEEFEAMETADARVAASFDRLQPFFFNALSDGHTWKKNYVTKQQVLDRCSIIIDIMPAFMPFILQNIEIAVEKGWIRK